jgi:hypothetical protein
VEDTPYRGFVVATAWDTTGTYLLYMDQFLNLRITKRQANGAYIQGRLLSSRTNVGIDGSTAQGDVVATGGRWWAVWREHVTPGGARAVTSTRPSCSRPTPSAGPTRPGSGSPPNPAWDGFPSLALTPGTTFPIRLVRKRGGSDFGATEGDVWRALGDQDGGWISTTLAIAGFLSTRPDVQMLGTTTMWCGTVTAAPWRPTTPAGRSSATPSPRRPCRARVRGSWSRPGTWSSAGPPSRRRSRRSWPSGSAPPGPGGSPRPASRACSS